MIIHLKIIGSLFMLLAIAHLIFPQYFKWKEELQNLSLINKQMMITHTFFIALTVFMMGLLCVTNTEDLISSDLGKAICLGLAIFWTIRLFIQFFGYSSKLWRGKLFETAVHFVFSLFWLYSSTIFWIVFFKN